MHSSTLLSILAISISLALAAPSHVLVERVPQLAASTTPAANATGNTTCSPAVLALVAGIQLNIADQFNELNTVTALGSILDQLPMDVTLYSATQTSLLGFVTKGIAIRENNQKIAPPGNGALPGLAIVAMAQLTELNLTMSLAVPASGIVNQTMANATVQALKGDFTGGIKQNMENAIMVCLASLPFPSLHTALTLVISKYLDLESIWKQDANLTQAMAGCTAPAT